MTTSKRRLRKLSVEDLPVLRNLKETVSLKQLASSAGVSERSAKRSINLACQWYGGTDTKSLMKGLKAHLDRFVRRPPRRS